MKGTERTVQFREELKTDSEENTSETMQIPIRSRNTLERVEFMIRQSVIQEEKRNREYILVVDTQYSEMI